MGTRIKLIAVVLVVCCWSVLGPGRLSAFDLGPFGARYYFLNQTYMQPWHHGTHDLLMQMRNEFNLELTYSKIPHTNFLVKLRPFYDTVFDISNQGTGGYAKFLRSGWAHNLGRNDDRDPLLRECYVDFTYGKNDLRLGRQIVAWGKSDGVFMLDVINPFNMRNPAEMKEELVKIPLWMINYNRTIGPGTLQGLFIFDQYHGTMLPGHRISEQGYHDWTFNTIALSNQIYVAFDDIFKNVFGIPEGYPVVQKAPAWNFKNSKMGLRWSQMVKGVNFTLNYFYTWSDYNDHPNTGDAVTATAIKRNPDRLQVYGFSLDKYFEEPINGVVRLESAYTRGQPFVLPDSNLQERDQIGYMLGYDRWIRMFYSMDYSPWLLSFQLWQNFILNPVHHKNAYVGPAATNFDWNTFLITNGLIDPIVTNLTGYLSHDGFFMGNTGHYELFLLQNVNEGYRWIWTRFRYEWTDTFQTGIGANFYWGNRDDYLGQFRRNNNIFFEVKYGFK